MAIFHHLSWENPLFQWPFSIAMFDITRWIGSMVMFSIFDHPIPSWRSSPQSRPVTAAHGMPGGMDPWPPGNQDLGRSGFSHEKWWKNGHL